MKKLLVFLLAVVLLGSCKKKEDSRDQYLGTWNFEGLGNITRYENGQILASTQIVGSGTLSITKSGDNDLLFLEDGQTEGRIYSVSGTNITSNPENGTETNNGINLVYTTFADGTLGPNLIIINVDINGTWNASNGTYGNLSGSSTTTLTR
tara:strand:+ start:85 stop:537 length:453 start_codon:yes stop_codon:yes gene_type:complete